MNATKVAPLAPEARQHIINAERILGELRTRLAQMPGVSGDEINRLDSVTLELRAARQGLRVRRVGGKRQRQ